VGEYLNLAVQVYEEVEKREHVKVMMETNKEMIPYLEHDEVMKHHQLVTDQVLLKLDLHNPQRCFQKLNVPNPVCQM